MPVWREPGETMGTVDLRQLSGDEIVIHYGGSLRSVDAYTFANSLIAFADTVRALNSQINPGQNIEVKVEALGEGSFRARIKKLKQGLGGFFSRGVETIFWGLIGAALYDNLIAKKGGHPDITIQGDVVIYQYGDDRIIMPREVHDALPAIRNNAEIQRGISRTFGAIAEDAAVENFGLTSDLRDVEPLLQMQKEEIAQLAEARAVISPSDIRRDKSESVRLFIVKAWLRRGANKWTFEWNGVPISARIKDATFLDAIERRDILLGAGDAIDAIISYQQSFDPDLQLYVNDPYTYEIVEVKKTVPKPRQGQLE